MPMLSFSKVKWLTAAKTITISWQKCSRKSLAAQNGGSLLRATGGNRQKSLVITLRIKLNGDKHKTYFFKKFWNHLMHCLGIVQTQNRFSHTQSHKSGLSRRWANGLLVSCIRSSTTDNAFFFLLFLDWTTVKGFCFFFLSILAACDQKPFHSWEEVLLLGEGVWSNSTGSPAFENKPRLGFLKMLSECCGVLWKNPDHAKSSDMASTWTLDSVWTNGRMKSFKL